METCKELVKKIEKVAAEKQGNNYLIENSFLIKSRDVLTDLGEELFNDETVHIDFSDYNIGENGKPYSLITINYVD